MSTSASLTMLNPLTVWITTNHEQVLKEWEYQTIQKLAFLKSQCLKATGSSGKETCNVGDLGSIPELGRSPRERKGYPFQYSGVENYMDCVVHGATKSWHDWATFNFTFALKATNLKYHRGKILHKFILNMKTTIANKQYVILHIANN